LRRRKLPLNTHRYLNAGFLELALTTNISIRTGCLSVHPLPSSARFEHHDEVQTLNERNVIQARSVSPIASAQPSTYRSYTGNIATSPMNLPAMPGDMEFFRSWRYHSIGRVCPNRSHIRLRELSKPQCRTENSFRRHRCYERRRRGRGDHHTTRNRSYDGIFRLNYHRSIATIPALQGLYSSMPLIAGLYLQLPGRERMITGLEIRS